MSWIATLKGNVDHLAADVAREAEEFVMRELAAIVAGLVEKGHTGVGGLFHFTKGSPANLVDPDASLDAQNVAAPAQANPVSVVPAEARTESVPYGTG